MSFASKYLKVGGRKFTTSGQSGTTATLSQSFNNPQVYTDYQTIINGSMGIATAITLYTTTIT